MMTKASIESGIEEIKRKYGEWTYDIPLPHGVWTRGKLDIPNTRLKRIVQIAYDLSIKPISECRILDLGCLDGIFSIEFALHGANTLGIEIREANIRKAIFCKEVLELENLEFLQEDVRNICLDIHGAFDIIICSGILYHLPGEDVFNLVSNMFAMTNRLVIIDTHIALHPAEIIFIDGIQYRGKSFREHADDSTQDHKAKQLWASWDNPTSFWFTRPSLINMLNRAGFSSVHESFVPPHINFGKPGIEHQDRCTFIAIKHGISNLFTSPAANTLKEDWPEGSLSYTRVDSVYERIKSLFKCCRT